MKSLSTIGAILLIVGALNWGLVGLGGFMNSNWNVVNLLLGSWPSVEWIVYILVGLAGIMALVNWKKMMSMM
ncbi:MAG TPA: DUF378 domain-containing protein [Candidatus Paceibacterota bacterium]|nr:DUF378 domain-containing protein [Candidatus Paceibacterota bacterium]